MDIVMKVRSPFTCLFLSVLLYGPQAGGGELKSTVLLVLCQFVVLRVEPFECFFAVLGEVWTTYGSDGAGEEAGLPVFVLLFPLCGFCALFLLDFRLEGGRERELFADYGVCDALPEFEGLVG